MSASKILAAADFGLDLLGAFGQVQGIKANTAIAEAQASMERQQIARNAEIEETDRINRLRSTLAGQRAAFGAMGVTGGRTRRLFERQAQMASRREQDVMDFRNLSRRQSVDFGVSTQRSGARVRQAQAFTGVLESALDNAGKMVGGGGE